MRPWDSGDEIAEKSLKKSPLHVIVNCMNLELWIEEGLDDEAEESGFAAGASNSVLGNILLPDRYMFGRDAAYVF